MSEQAEAIRLLAAAITRLAEAAEHQIEVMNQATIEHEHARKSGERDWQAPEVHDKATVQ